MSSAPQTVPTALDRDHPRRLAINHGVVDPLGQFRCDACGAFFLLRATFERHRVIERPAFMAQAAAKQATYEESRRVHRERYPHRSRQDIEVAERRREIRAV